LLGDQSKFAAMIRISAFSKTLSKLNKKVPAPNFNVTSLKLNNNLQFNRLHLRNFAIASDAKIVKDLDEYLQSGETSFSFRRKPQREEDYKRRDARSYRSDNTSSRSTEPLSNWKDNIEQSTKFDYKMYEETEVGITGKNPPSPIQTWEEMKLDPALLENIKKANFLQPVAMQKYVIPAALQDRDLIMTAQTGSGKTASFLFPLITKIAALRSPPRRESTTFPRALILGPTRELVQQIYAEARLFCKGTGVKPSVIFGGASTYEQARELRSGQPADILIATPGRMTDFLERKNVGVSDVKFLVLDEADRMLDMGFEPDIRAIVCEWDMPSQRQTMMYSATFPKEIQHMSHRYLKDNLFMTFGRVGAATSLVQQSVVEVKNDEERDSKLISTVKQHLETKDGNILIFFERKTTVEDYYWKLRDHGIKSVTIHGDKSQEARNTALHAFASGKSRVLLATAVASRGLDLKNIEHVINYEMPRDMDDYVHRIGRTGRAGKKGVSTIFVAQNEHPIAMKKLISILLESNQEVPAFLEDAVGYRQTRSRGQRGNSGSFRRPGGNNFDRGSQGMFQGGRSSRQGGRMSRQDEEYMRRDQEFARDFGNSSDSLDQKFEKLYSKR